MIESSGIRLQDRSGVAEARRVAVGHAAGAGFDKAAQSNVAIVATELATNLLAHARDGVLAITSERFPSRARVLIVAVDKGPGIADLSKSFADGYSSAGTAGTGLGAVSRLSTAVDVYSTPAGTVLAAVLARPGVRLGEGPVIGGIAVPKEGQQSNGDGWDCRTVDGGFAVLVCDGLGHGAHARDALTAAVEAFRSMEWRGPKEALSVLDVALRATRGAAAAVAFLDPSSGRLRYCGVGNIAASIVLDDTSRHLVSHNGILGHTSMRIAEFDYELDPQGILVMHTDGISARWEPGSLGRVSARHPALVAGLLYRDFGRGNDDVAAVVIKR